MHQDTQAYNESHSKSEIEICNLLATEICAILKNAENKIWHGHPVWFLDGNPIVGYSKLKNCIQLLFWSGQSFDESALKNTGKFKASEIRFTSIKEIDKTEFRRWVKKALAIQWDYKNLIQKKRLNPLKGIPKANASQSPSLAKSSKFKTIEEYQCTFPTSVQVMLEQIRKAIRQAAPEAIEVISYNMPAFKLNSVLVYYAVNKEHIGFYPTPSPIQFFKKELTMFSTSKGAIQFPMNKPMPILLIKKIVTFRLEEDIAKVESQKGNKKNNKLVTQSS